MANYSFPQPPPPIIRNCSVVFYTFFSGFMSGGGAYGLRCSCAGRSSFRTTPSAAPGGLRGAIMRYGGFPNWGTLLGVSIIRTIVLWGLYWGPLILGNYHMVTLHQISMEHPTGLTTKLFCHRGLYGVRAIMLYVFFPKLRVLLWHPYIYIYM